MLFLKLKKNSSSGSRISATECINKIFPSACKKIQYLLESKTKKIIHFNCQKTVH